MCQVSLQRYLALCLREAQQHQQPDACTRIAMPQAALAVLLGHSAHCCTEAHELTNTAAQMPITR